MLKIIRVFVPQREGYTAMGIFDMSAKGVVYFITIVVACLFLMRLMYTWKEGFSDIKYQKRLIEKIDDTETNCSMQFKLGLMKLLRGIMGCFLFLACAAMAAVAHFWQTSTCGLTLRLF